MKKVKEKNEISVCSCGEPLVWTFAFAYKEWLCLSCGETYGALGVNRVPETKELKYKHSLYKKLWGILYGKEYFLPRSSYAVQGCKDCTSDNHREHLSDKEMIKDKIGTEIFKKLTAPHHIIR